MVKKIVINITTESGFLKHRNCQILMLILMSLFLKNFPFTLQIPYPLFIHGDLADINYYTYRMIDSQRILASSPDFPELTGYPPGYFTIMVLWNALTGVSYTFLITNILFPLLAPLSVIVVYALVKRISGRSDTGMIAAFLFLLMTPNIFKHNNLTFFPIPQSVGMVLLMVALCVAFRTKEFTTGRVTALALLLASTFMVHSPSALFLMLVLLVQVVYLLSSRRKPLRLILALALGVAISSPYWVGGALNPFPLAGNAFTYSMVHTPVTLVWTEEYLAYLNPVYVALALLGVLFCVRNRESRIVVFWFALFFAIASFASLLFMNNLISDYTAHIWTMRLLEYLMLPTIFLASIGLANVSKFIPTYIGSRIRVENWSFGVRRVLAGLPTRKILVIVVLFLIFMSSIGPVLARTDILIVERRYPAPPVAKWLRDNTPKDAVVLSDFRQAFNMRVYSEREFMLLEAGHSGWVKPEDYIEKFAAYFLIFTSSDEALVRGLLYKHDVKYIVIAKTAEFGIFSFYDHSRQQSYGQQFWTVDTYQKFTNMGLREVYQDIYHIVFQVPPTNTSSTPDIPEKALQEILWITEFRLSAEAELGEGWEIIQAESGQIRVVHSNSTGSTHTLRLSPLPRGELGLYARVLQRGDAPVSYEFTLSTKNMRVKVGDVHLEPEKLQYVSEYVGEVDTTAWKDEDLERSFLYIRHNGEDGVWQDLDFVYFLPRSLT